jgi:hypothetical protein
MAYYEEPIVKLWLTKSKKLFFIYTLWFTRVLCELLDPPGGRKNHDAADSDRNPIR